MANKVQLESQSALHSQHALSGNLCPLHKLRTVFASSNSSQVHTVSKCSAYLRTANSSKKLCACILVQSDDTLLHLTACKDVLKEAFPDLATMSEATLAELILEKESVTITYHTTNRTIKKLITEK